MKKQFLFLLGLLLFMTACTNKPQLLSEDLIEQSIMSNTKKAQLYSSLEIKAAITATYLNASLPEYEKSPHEMFLVSIFIDNDSAIKEKQGIYNRDYSLTLNGAKATRIEALEFKDDLLKKLPTRNRWSHYYLIGFDKSNKQKLQLVFKSAVYGTKVLVFPKEF